MVVILQILIIGSYLNCYSAQNLFDTFMPGIRTRLGYTSYPYTIRRGHVPLYMQSGPNPFMDYMIHPLIPRRLVKRFRRHKRQLAENDQRFQDLLDSFGGNPEMTNAEPEIEAESINSNVETSTVKNGFYFLLDWNSFLEVDDQNGRRVNLRINPKVGDPKRFFSVSVP